MKSITRFSAVVLVWCVSAAAVQAQDGKSTPIYSPEYKKCMDDSQGADPIMQECINDEIDAQEELLNEVYRQIMDKWRDAEYRDLRVSLVAAERAWVAYRRAQCDFAYTTEEGGSLARIVGQGCHLDMTYKRIQDLRDILKNN